MVQLVLGQLDEEAGVEVETVKLILHVAVSKDKRTSQMHNRR